MGKREESEYQRVVGYDRCAKGEFDEALFHYRRAVEIDPSHDLAAFQLGLVCLELGDYESTIAMLCRTIKPYEDCAESHYYLGMACYMKGEYGKAGIHFSKAIAQRPRYFDPPRSLRIDPYGLPNAYYWRGRARNLAEKPDAKALKTAGEAACGTDEGGRGLMGGPSAASARGKSPQALPQVQLVLFPDS
jgi:tetratricopeptide (TPR) repeat protein